MIEQTRTRPQETPELKMNEQMQSFSFSPPINLLEGGKWVLGLTSFEAINYVFNIENQNCSFSISIPGYWIARGGQQTIIRMKELVELREENDIELHAAEVRKRANHLKIGDNE